MSLPILSPQAQRIANEAKEDPHRVFTNLAHLIDEELLWEAFWLLKRSGAVGVDRVSWQEYEAELAGNIRDLHMRLKEQRYRAQPVKGVCIEKEDGKKRQLGIPTLEDKLVQRALVMVLEPIYEQDFLDCSYGFRRKRNAHQALHRLREVGMKGWVNWVIDADIQGFFDQLDHGILFELLHRRVKDGGVDRLIGKWLNAGILQGGELLHPERGTAQGNVISPLLANIYLHYVLDEWFESEVKPRLRGRAEMVRYADDFVISCERKDDALRVMRVLSKRLKRFGLGLHPEKSRLVRYYRQRRWREADREIGTFDFLGFTHYWAKSYRGYWVIKRKTMSKRQTRAIKKIRQWCKKHRHKSLKEQHVTLRRKLQGLYQYYGIRGNSDALSKLYCEVVRTWRKWLGRRSQKSRINWKKFKKLLEQYPLPQPEIVHWSI